MPTIATKQQLLKDAGYAYVFDRMIYVNRDTKKVFSVQFIDDNDEDKLAACISDPQSQDGHWHFYFNTPPSESVKQQLLAVLD